MRQSFAFSTLPISAVPAGLVSQIAWSGINPAAEHHRPYFEQPVAGAASRHGVKSSDYAFPSGHEVSFVPVSDQSPGDRVADRSQKHRLLGILAWLIPGLGHFGSRPQGQGRDLPLMYPRAPSFMASILGGSPQVGWGGRSHFSFHEKEWRLPWLCSDRACPGLPTLPMTLLQSSVRKPLLNGSHGPARARSRPSRTIPALATIQRLLPHYFELGTVYTVISPAC